MTEPGGFDGVNYSEFIAPLVAAVQELATQNAALKTRLDAMGGTSGTNR
jgi:hypothetical protein